MQNSTFVQEQDPFVMSFSIQWLNLRNSFRYFSENLQSSVSIPTLLGSFWRDLQIHKELNSDEETKFVIIKVSYLFYQKVLPILCLRHLFLLQVNVVVQQYSTVKNCFCQNVTTSRSKLFVVK
jgi:hypothetical protein